LHLVQKDVEAAVHNNDNVDDIICYNFSVIRVFELYLCASYDGKAWYCF